MRKVSPEPEKRNDAKERIIFEFLCGNCGKPVEKTFSFCPYCRGRIDWNEDRSFKPYHVPYVVK